MRDRRKRRVGLKAVSGFGESRTEKYGAAFLKVLAEGAGNGNVVYTVSPQSTLRARTGTVTVTPEAASGMLPRTHVVTQAAATPALSAAANETVYPREATVRIAEKAFRVSQRARGVEVECDNKLFGRDGGRASVSVHPDGNVAWTAVASDDWIVVYQGDSGTGDAEILYIVKPYTGDGSPRTGTITVGDKVIYVTQRAYDLDISSKGDCVTGSAGAGEIGVPASIGDVWSAIVTEPWISIVTGYDAGTDSGTVRFTYTDNDTGKTRTGKIIVAGEVYTLTQAARVLVAVTADVAKRVTAHFAPLTPEFTSAESSTDGDAAWTPVVDVVAKVGESAVRSGAVGMEQSGWLEATVHGKGTLSFWWKTSCEPDPRGRDTYDHVTFAADGEDRAKLDGETDW